MAGQFQHLAEVWWQFHRLGWTAFGGPSAHFVYFRDAFVLRRHWLSETVYVEFLALVQLLPGPSSTQLAVILGIARAGLAGGLVAWIAWVLPAAAIMFGFATFVGAWGGVATAQWLHGLKVVVVGVVAQAVMSMGARLCPDWPRRAIAALGVLIALALAGTAGQLLTIGFGGLAGWLVGKGSGATLEAPAISPVKRPTAAFCLVLFVAFLLALPVAQAMTSNSLLSLADRFYRAGALVFGGGHVILPLLQAELVQPGLISAELFLTGYGAVQALPGPLFTFAGYLGALVSTPLPPVLSAALCLFAIFLPSVLVLLGVLPFWATLRALPGMGAVLAGVGAAVVGLLGAALIDPIWSSAIHDAMDFALAALAFTLLFWGRLPAWAVVIGCAALAALLPT